MEKINKQKILSVVLIIALFASTLGAFTLIYNAIEMLTYTTFFHFYDWEYILDDGFTAVQMPMGIIALVAAIVELLGVAAGVTAFVAKKPKLKMASMIVCLCVVAAFLVFIAAAAGKWSSFYYEDNKTLQLSGFPIYITGTVSEAFVIYSSVASALVQQIICFAIAAAAVTISYILDIKSAKPARTAEEPASEQVDSSEQTNSQENI